MKPHEFLSRWKQGMKDLTPKQQLSAKVTGLQGSIAGIIIGFIFLTMKGNWYFLILGFFMIWLQVIELIGTKQQLENIKRIEENYGG